MDSPPDAGSPSSPDKDSFKIPEPYIDPAFTKFLFDSISLKESNAFSESNYEKWKKSSPIWDWKVRVYFRIALFIFVLVINGAWSYEIIKILWASGRTSGGFHLSDSVLIALVSTSIANFLGLVVIVARHLFPSGSSN
jgi:hypothetical protein